MLTKSASVVETDEDLLSSESVSASVLPKKEIAKTKFGKITESGNFIIKILPGLIPHSPSCTAESSPNRVGKIGVGYV